MQSSAKNPVTKWGIEIWLNLKSFAISKMLKTGIRSAIFKIKVRMMFAMAKITNRGVVATVNAFFINFIIKNLFLFCLSLIKGSAAAIWFYLF